MTNAERIANMDAAELAKAAVQELRIGIMADLVYMSMLDATCYPTKELAVAHNKEWLAKEAKEV